MPSVDESNESGKATEVGDSAAAPIRPSATQRRSWWNRTSLRAVVVMALLSGFAIQTQAVPSVLGQSNVGQGFTVSPSDLAYILQQIKIAEHHVAATTSQTGPCGALLGTGPDQVASPLLSLGLRTVDGTCNNLQASQEKYGASDQFFPRLTTAVFQPAENTSNMPFPIGPSTDTSYANHSGVVVDTEPRMISNLIVDQTSSNPAAIAASRDLVRDQGGTTEVVACTSPGVPSGCIPAHETLFIPNVTTDVGLSPPFNSLFTLFGQFFDHGLDFTSKGGNGTVFVPLKADDPLVAGPNHIFGDSDDLPVDLRFMTLTRATVGTGTEATNRDTPFVDQSQTYTSHASHQVFLREYVDNNLGRPVATGKLLHADGDAQMMPTWATVKATSASMLGLLLTDANVGNIPMIATDPYGKFIPGPLRGLPQYATTTGLVEGDRANPVPVPANALFINTAFLDDIAHSAAPKFSAPGVLFPDGNNTAGSSLSTPSPAGSYDNELLDMHFICGDGRCNENIGLSAIHQIFHSEHDRLVDDIKNTLLSDQSGITSLTDWQSSAGADGWNGERLFQAARFVTEMEYQHLVFEEFARKVQPAINPFEPLAFIQTDTRPDITAEFAHAVYRFGHSMLTDTISRTNANGSHNDITLLDGFLNPAEYTDGGSAGPLDAVQAAGSIIMGMSDQTGNEIDEFVTETLRNNLLGLPLDLAAINITRARSEGIPPLNQVRRQLFDATNDGQLTPYTSWIDFGMNLKHPESLINFVAAYGTHSSITAQTTLAGKREAARLIVAPDTLNGDVAPEDASDFLNSTFYPGADAVPASPGPDQEFGTDCGTLDATQECADNTEGTPAVPAKDWSNIGTRSITGLDDVDLWMGGLAENTNLFGGLLGSTFNYVFENQLTDLQNSDRFYYLARTPGMNLRSQLEGNSFAELMMRNTNVHTLKADAFATADCKFEMANLNGTPAGYAATGNTVADDLASDCDESALLIRLPDGTIQYRARNSVDPAGINGQSVYNGTTNADRIKGGNDNDTFWGGQGNDIIDGQGGDDITLGGVGHDLITDSAGLDVIKGGPGNDALDGGIGDDIMMGGDGHDFINGGANLNTTFAGAGNDLVIAGQSLDVVFGDSGDDWIEGGDQPDLLQGEGGSLLFDDHNVPGHDVLVGQAGDDDYDMEGGDDIGVAGPGIEKNAGAAGWDWLIGLNDPQPQNTDLSLPLVGVILPINAVRDKFNEVESLSGWDLDDTLRGDSIIPSQLGGGGFIGCDALDDDGVARIAGLDQLVTPAMRTVDSAPIVAAASTNYCGLNGLVWGEGNILLGGRGNDLIEGRGGNDIIDGDRYVNVRLSVRAGIDANGDATGSEIASTDLMEHAALSGSFYPGAPATTTLQQAVFAGKVNPGQITIVREIVTPPPSRDVDIAQYNGVRTDYTITSLGGGAFTVAHTVLPGGGGGGGGGGGAATDNGTDIVRNIERLRFCSVVDVDGNCVRFSDLNPSIFATPSSLNFGQVKPNSDPATSTVTITNPTGSFVSLAVASIGLTGANASSFSQTNDCVNVPAGSTCTIAVTMSTAGPAGARSATLVVTSNAFSSPLNIAVFGTISNNTPASGAPSLDDLNPTETEAIAASTAGIIDPDGIPAVVSYQWQRGEGSVPMWTDIAGATSAIYTPVQSDVTTTAVPRVLRVVVRYTDLGGAAETVNSAATSEVGDFINDGNGGNTLIGTAGEDIINGNGGADNISGLGGNDRINGGAGADAINGGLGADVIRISSGSGVDAINGGGGGDTIQATGNNVVIGLSSLAGITTITAAGFTGVSIEGNGAANSLDFSGVSLIGITAIDAGGGADTVIGSVGADVVLGGAAGDIINGGLGNDRLTGGGGADVFQFGAATPFGTDTITDFAANVTDLLDVSALGITSANFTASVAITVGVISGVTTTTVTISGGRGVIRLPGVTGGGGNRVTIADFILAP